MFYKIKYEDVKTKVKINKVKNIKKSYKDN